MLEVYWDQCWGYFFPNEDTHMILVFGYYHNVDDTKHR